MIKVGVIIENGQVQNIRKFEKCTSLDISLGIANLEIIKLQLVQMLDEMTRVNPSNTPLVKKEVGKATADPTQKVKSFKRPEDIKNCSDKQYATLRKAGFEDLTIKSMSQTEIRKSIGAYFDSLKKENI